MGPVIGMTPDKRAETPGAEKFAGLNQIYKMGSLPEVGDAARPKATLVGTDSADDELTNLNWLHENSNLLTNFRLGSEGFPMVSPLYDIEGDDVPVFGPSCYQNPEKKSATSKPPYSFSLLIYMAIEHSPNKCLPVKEIYSWILDRFPYFATAPTGWKKSVRHNLSLNKCFQKVERSHGKPSLQKKRGYSSAFSAPGAARLQESHPPAASIDPKADHNYSANSMAAQRCASRASVSSMSSVDEVYEFIPKSSHVGSDGSEGFHSDEDTDAEDEDDRLGDSGYAPQAHEDSAPEGQPGKKKRKQSCQEIDEELKEAAGSLLHLAGIRTCLGSLISTAKAQSQKHRKK
ncbi:Forkhead box protein N2 [Microtus ochrogaster]|uniref:Forkhead box protein N2 n=1 Tax=Microtus ochrogaster TaxID=79684 RepID=A0A8J6GIM7_MICOH|nr:Forkhead box protein N2 [Microtus ochrogaster]